MLRPVVAVVLAFGCGRIAFEPRETIFTNDGSGGLPDGQVLGCGEPAPSLFLIAPREEGSSGRLISVQWCSTGLTGSLTARMLDGSLAVFKTATAPVTVNAATIDTGGTSCGDCFVRLEADGVIYDGPIGFHSGD